MLTIKNRPGKWFACLVVCATVLAGCTPPGPRAVLEGKRLLEKKKYPQAVEKLELATSIVKTNAQAFNYLGLAYHHAGRSSDAEKAYRRALALDRDLTEAHYNLGCLWLDENKLDAAKTELTAYVLRRASSPEGFLKLGAVQLLTRETAAAEKSFNEALRFNAADPEAITGLGLARLQRGRVAEATDHFHNALSNVPGYGPALLNLAIVQQQYLQDRTAALSSYQAYLALKPPPDNANEVRTIVQQLESETRAAARIASAPEQAAPTLARSSVSASNSAPPIAETSRRPPNSRPEPLAGSAGKSEPGASSGAITAVLPNAGGSPERSLPGSGRSAFKASAEETSRRTESRAAGAPEAPKTSAQSSGLQSVDGSSSAPKRGFLQRINPLSLFSGSGKGSSPATAGEGGKAADTTLGSGVGSGTAGVPYVYLSPRKPASGNRAGAMGSFREALRDQQAHRLPEAIRGYRRAIQTDPTYFEAYYNLALAYTESGDASGAFWAYECALAVKPSSPDARYNFALLLKQQKHPLDAANELDKLLVVNPQETRAHLALGNLYAQQLDQPEKARSHYLKVLAADPQNPQAEAIRYWLADHPK